MKLPRHLVGLPCAAALLLIASCAGPGSLGKRALVYDTASGDAVRLATAVERLAEADVVFLGEEHGNDQAHELQLATLRALHRRRPEIVLSMEQFESDVQGVLDAYLRGEIDEESFLEASRPWPNYRRNYRPMIEWARERGVPVIAANVPRGLARRTTHVGYESVAGYPDSPWGLYIDEPEYRALFEAAMSGHGSLQQPAMNRWFEAQCIKDDKMAESIARHLAEAAPRRPLVVHVCGKFHSDRGLGTVSRLLRRRPDLQVAVVSTSSRSPLDAPLDEAERRAGDYLFRVPPK